MEQDEKLIKLLSLLASDMQTIQNSMQSIQKDLIQLHAYTSSTDEEVRKFREEINATTGELKSLAGRIMIVENQISDNTEAIRRSQANESSLESEVNKLLSSSEMTANSMEDASRNIRIASDGITKTSDDVLQLRMEFDRLAQNENDITNSLSVLRQDMEATRAELQTSNMDAFSMKEQLDRVTASMEEVRALNEDYLHNMNSIEGKITDIGSRVYEIIEEINKDRSSIQLIDQHIEDFGVTQTNLIADLERIDERVDNNHSATQEAVELIKELKGSNDSFISAMRSLY